ncbi:hypothetical protein LCGC14_1011190 [marine sediment metagenome]|uniref:Uncharacterized protein n=1 Tax=marine sediment metagenome TaxID=412755 RepID=A0A0F9QIG9_9ZZZZ
MSTTKYGTREFTVDGELVVCDLDNDFLIDDIDDGMAKAPGRIAFFGQAYAASIEEEARVTAHYRHWKAKLGQAITEDDPKLAQTKVTQRIEATPDFLTHKEAQARALRNVESLRLIVEAFKAQASLLQSKGANARAALQVEGLSTKLDAGGGPATREEGAANTEKARAATRRTRQRAQDK